jgi:NAD dependent epimerase/dehydratase family enzyme
MKILITGGTGLIGRFLIPRLQELDHSITVVTRDPAKAQQTLGDTVALLPGLDDLTDLNDFGAVINLAGEPIAEKRWSDEQKQRLCESRWKITQRLVDLILASANPPEVFISGSAVGYYGDRGCGHHGRRDAA